MNVKQISISSYSDLEKISPFTLTVHFRKFVSRKIVSLILERHQNVRVFSFPSNVASKCDSSIFSEIEQRKVKIVFSSRRQGRPNILEMIL